MERVAWYVDDVGSIPRFGSLFFFKKGVARGLLSCDFALFVLGFLFVWLIVVVFGVVLLLLLLLCVCVCVLVVVVVFFVLFVFFFGGLLCFDFRVLQSARRPSITLLLSFSPMKSRALLCHVLNIKSSNKKIIKKRGCRPHD